MLCIAGGDGYFKRVNPAFERILGHSEQEFLSRPFLEFVHPADREATLRELRSLQEGRPTIHFENRYRCRDGSYRWVSWRARPTERGECIYAVARDVTELKDAEELARSSLRAREALSEIIQNSLEPVSLDEILHRTLDLLLSIPWIALQSKGAVFVAEENSRTLVMKAHRGFPQPLVEGCAKVPFGRCLCGRAADRQQTVFKPNLDSEHEILFPDMCPHGHYCVPIISDGSVLGVLTVYLNENHTRAPEEESLLSSVANVLAGIIKRRRAEARIAERNEQLARSNDELLRTLAALKTEHERLTRVQSQLIEAAKIESVGRLAAGIAHEVKNPLAIASLAAEFLKSRVVAPDAEVDNALSEIQQAIWRADVVVRGLMQLAKPAKVNRSAARLSDVIDGALLMLKRELARSHVTVLKEYADSLPLVHIDSASFAQLFVNLLMNAIDAMPQGGTLTVSTYACASPSEATGEGDARVYGLAPGDVTVVAEVQDTGTGIPQDKLVHVFDPFFTTKPAGKGTGLGLAVARSIVGSHGGTIDLANRREGGVKVTIRLKGVKSHDDIKDEGASR
jgi:PAS domain S-box-containing protein